MPGPFGRRNGTAPPPGTDAKVIIIECSECRFARLAKRLCFVLYDIPLHLETSECIYDTVLDEVPGNLLATNLHVRDKA